MYFLWYILIGLVAGWLASLLMKGSGSGLILNIVIGILGGVLGGWLLSLFGVIAVGTFGSLVTSFIGAVVLLLIVGILGHRRKE
ncbi:MAG: GlsB/YeaQ/YmgE family stress response membrane protein [Rikenellaceae bacterium]|nr:GlsB/YeaQ/YmgE family stress response membrane protein [Rikenellaceae bacterium]